ncbi:MAG: recombinase family protein [Planctomycetota bacterium]|jgi:DNA invertase Pin-like site-specific DNA recombinase
MAHQGAGNQRRHQSVGYVRRSTDRQEQSIPDQKKAIKDYAAEHGLRLSKFYVDDAISGTSTLGRRAFQQMIQDAQSPARGFDVIIVYDVKRFGRIDNDEAGYYRHLLRTHGVEVCYVSENFNGDSTDDLLRPVKQWQARQESKDLSKVTIRGLLSKMDDKGGGNGKGGRCGWWMGGVPSHGYDLSYETADGAFLFLVRYMPDGSKRLLDEKGSLTRRLARGESLNISKRDRAKLTPSSPERVQVIKTIFRMYAEQGKGFKSVAETLNLDDVPTPRGPAWSHIYSGQWTDTTIRSILVNPVYVGDMVWNRRTDGRFHQIRKGRAVERERVHGARLVPNDESDWIIVRDAHPALISRRVFEQARQRRESQPTSIEQRGKDPRVKAHGKTWNGQRSRFILSGLLTCSLCGNRYQGVTRHKGKKLVDGSRVTTRYYGCGGHVTKGKKICEMNPIPQDALEAIVIEAVLDYYKPFIGKGGRRRLAEAVKQQMGSEREDFTAARKRVEAEHQRIGGIINNLLDNITSANREFADKRLKELTDQRQQLETRLDELDRLTATQAEIQAIVSDAGRFLSSLEFSLRQGVPQERLVALRQCIERIHINKPTSEIEGPKTPITCWQREEPPQQHAGCVK